MKGGYKIALVLFKALATLKEKAFAVLELVSTKLYLEVYIDPLKRGVGEECRSC